MPLLDTYTIHIVLEKTVIGRRALASIQYYTSVRPLRMKNQSMYSYRTTELRAMGDYRNEGAGGDSLKSADTTKFPQRTLLQPSLSQMSLFKYEFLTTVFSVPSLRRPC